MAVNRGKDFEQRVKEDLLRLGADVSLERLPDQMSGYRGSKNPCDYFCYMYPNLYYLECKTTNENTFPISGLTQYDSLLERRGRRGVRSGVLLWAIKHEKVFYIPISTFEKLKAEGKKSFNVKYESLPDYPSIVLPSKKRRVFLETDYTLLTTLDEGW